MRKKWEVNAECGMRSAEGVEELRSGEGEKWRS